MIKVLQNGTFNANDYTHAELEYIYFNKSILHSKFCSESFRNDATAYINQNEPRFGDKGAFKSYSDDIKPSNSNRVKIYNDVKDIIEQEKRDSMIIDALHKLWKYPLGNIIQTESNEIKQYIKIGQSHTGQIMDLADYYCAWNIFDYNLPYSSKIMEFISFVFALTGSIENVIKFTSTLEPAETIDKIQEQIFNASWGGDERFEEYRNLPELELRYLQSLIVNKGIESISLCVSLANLPIERKKFFEWVNEQDYSSEDLSDQAINKIKELTAFSNEEYKSKTQELEKSGFDVDNLVLCASKFKMPKDIFEKLIQDLLKRQEVTDNISKILLSEQATESAIVNLNEDFKSSESFSFYISETEKKMNSKTPQAKLLLKTDPTALFIGKMTKCCQFYTGHSSDYAVMPVYNDPNAGLFVLYRSGKL